MTDRVTDGGLASKLIVEFDSNLVTQSAIESMPSVLEQWVHFQRYCAVS